MTEPESVEPVTSRAFENIPEKIHLTSQSGYTLDHPLSVATVTKHTENVRGTYSHKFDHTIHFSPLAASKKKKDDSNESYGPFFSDLCHAKFFETPRRRGVGYGMYSEMNVSDNVTNDRWHYTIEPRAE